MAGDTVWFLCKTGDDRSLRNFLFGFGIIVCKEGLIAARRDFQTNRIVRPFVRIIGFQFFAYFVREYPHYWVFRRVVIAVAAEDLIAENVFVQFFRPPLKMEIAYKAQELLLFMGVDEVFAAEEIFQRLTHVIGRNG